MNQNSEENKKNAVEFYRTAYNGNPRKAVELYVGNEYIQHNPIVGDGKESFIKYFERMATEYPDKSIKFVRTVAEGNLTALHTHRICPGNEEYVTMDFFKFDENRKITNRKIRLTTIRCISTNNFVPKLIKDSQSGEYFSVNLSYIRNFHY